MSILLLGATRPSEVRMAAVRCVMPWGPILCLRQGGTRGKSSGSSARKTGFGLCCSGIIEIGSVACTGQTRSHYRVCVICPAQRGGEFPKSEKHFFPHSVLQFLS